MSVYTFADVHVRLPSLSPFAMHFFQEYRADSDHFDEELTITQEDLAAEAILAPLAPREVLEITVVLRKFANRLLMRYDGFMLHAATVVYGGKAYAFAAPSGTGKTTHCRLWLDVLGDDARILNGDKLLLRKQGDRFFAYGNPWNGKEGYGERGCYPLGGVFLLHRATENTVSPTTSSEALAALLSASAVSKSGADRLQILALLDCLIQHVGVRNVYANMTHDAVYTVLRELEDSL